MTKTGGTKPGGANLQEVGGLALHQTAARAGWSVVSASAIHCRLARGDRPV